MSLMDYMEWSGVGCRFLDNQLWALDIIVSVYIIIQKFLSKLHLLLL